MLLQSIEEAKSKDANITDLVSIPQAVSAIAIQPLQFTMIDEDRFNTASGKCYCN